MLCPEKCIVQPYGSTEDVASHDRVEHHAASFIRHDVYVLTYTYVLCTYSTMNWPAPPTCHVIVSGLPHAIEIGLQNLTQTRLAFLGVLLGWSACPWLTGRVTGHSGTRTRSRIMALCRRPSTWPSLLTGTTTCWSCSIHWAWLGTPASTYSGKEISSFSGGSL